MADWRKVASLDEVVEGTPVGTEIEGTAIGLFKVGDEVFALFDICPHEYALLSAGFQDGHTVECPLHQALFDIKTGKHLSPPAQCGVKSFPTQIRDGVVFVDIAAKS